MRWSRDRCEDMGIEDESNVDISQGMPAATGAVVTPCQGSDT